MLFVFVLGFLFGAFGAQEAPHFPNVKQNAMYVYDYAKDMVKGTDIR